MIVCIAFHYKIIEHVLVARKIGAVPFETESRQKRYDLSEWSTSESHPEICGDNQYQLLSLEHLCWLNMKQIR